MTDCEGYISKSLFFWTVLLVLIGVGSFMIHSNAWEAHQKLNLQYCTLTPIVFSAFECPDAIDSAQSMIIINIIISLIVFIACIGTLINKWMDD